VLSHPLISAGVLEDPPSKNATYMSDYLFILFTILLAIFFLLNTLGIGYFYSTFFFAAIFFSSIITWYSIIKTEYHDYYLDYFLRSICFLNRSITFNTSVSVDAFYSWTSSVFVSVSLCLLTYSSQIYSSSS